MVAEQEDKKNERVGMIVSITVHAVILIVFLFLFAYVPPDPPKPGHPGVEIAFGLETTGSGDNNDNAPVNEVQENPTEEVEPQPEPDPVEEVVEPVDASHIDTESPHVIEKKETKEPTPKTEVKKETKKEEVKKVETTKEEITTTKTTNSEGKGDDKEAGNKGDKNGTLNKDALYGNNPGDGGAGGNSEGTTLDLGGWRMGFTLDQKDQTNENGYIIYQVKVDEDGGLISCNPISQTVSSTVVKFYREQIFKNWEIYRERGTKTAPASIGTLKVIVKSQ